MNLVIWLDEKLTFKPHIDKLVLKSRQKIGFLYRNRTSFPKICRKRVIEAVFLSVLDYGDIVYRHASATALKPLDSVYHSALRFITGDPFKTHHCSLYEKVGWTSLSLRRELHWFLFIFKSLIGKQPPYLSAMLDWNSQSFNTRSSELLLLKVPRAHSKLGTTAFSYSAPTSWNALQSNFNMTILPTFSSFKSMISDFHHHHCICFN